MTLVLLVGKKGSGKDTAADYLVKKGWIKVSFADILKEGLKVLFNFNDDQLWGDKKEELDNFWGICPRYLLQSLGTDFLRDYIKDHINLEIKIKNNKYKFSYHIKRLHQKVEALLKQGHNVVVADTRFQDEINWGKLMEGQTIKIIRSNIKMNEYSKHKSENIDILKKIDYVIENNSSLENLYKKIENYI